jgi:hypothetical protein
VNPEADVFIKESPCPNCGYVCDGAWDVKKHCDQVPEEGDVSVCIRCACVSEFTAELDRRQVTIDEFQALPIDLQNQLFHAILSIHAVNAEAKKK